jgi:hypothetical protein
MSRQRSILTTAAALIAAALIWFPSLSWWFTPTDDEIVSAGLSPWARRLTEYQLHFWEENVTGRGNEVAKVRRTNAEWDFMARSFLVWSLVEVGLREPAYTGRVLPIVDRIIDETLALERVHGQRHFLMDYADDAPWIMQPWRSQFVDGEIALMLAMRRLLREQGTYAGLLRERLTTIVDRMRQNPLLSAESYPNECWTFCNVVALAAMRIADHLDGSDHHALLRDWAAMARKNLVDPDTGLLFSAYTMDGLVLQGPEGSSIWAVAHFLRLVDAGLAAEQYRIARRQLGRELLGFGYAAEWPAAWRTGPDVDSGAVIPVLDASAGSSGMALIGAAAFDDRDYFQALVAALNLAAFPTDDANGLHYQASNPAGDAAMLYAGVLGLAWRRVMEARP